MPSGLQRLLSVRNVRASRAALAQAAAQEEEECDEGQEVVDISLDVDIDNDAPNNGTPEAETKCCVPTLRGQESERVDVLSSGRCVKALEDDLPPISSLDDLLATTEVTKKDPTDPKEDSFIRAIVRMSHLLEEKHAEELAEHGDSVRTSVERVLMKAYDIDRTRIAQIFAEEAEWRQEYAWKESTELLSKVTSHPYYDKAHFPSEDHFEDWRQSHRSCLHERIEEAKALPVPKHRGDMLGVLHMHVHGASGSFKHKSDINPYVVLYSGKHALKRKTEMCPLPTGSSELSYNQALACAITDTDLDAEEGIDIKVLLAYKKRTRSEIGHAHVKLKPLDLTRAERMTTQLHHGKKEVGTVDITVSFQSFPSLNDPAQQAVSWLKSLIELVMADESESSGHSCKDEILHPIYRGLMKELCNHYGIQRSTYCINLMGAITQVPVFSLHVGCLREFHNLLDQEFDPANAIACEREHLSSMISDLSRRLTERVETFRSCFRDGSGEQLAHLLNLHSVIHSQPKYQSYITDPSHQHTDRDSYLKWLRQLLESGIHSYFQSVADLVSADDLSKTMCELIVRVLQDIRCLDSLNPSLPAEIDVLELAIPMYSNFIDMELQNYFLDLDPTQTPEYMFDIFYTMRDFEHEVCDLDPEFIPKKFSHHFYPFLCNFVETSSEKLLEKCSSALATDKLEPMSERYWYSTSVSDVFSLCFQHLDSFKRLDWPRISERNQLALTLIQAINMAAASYTAAMFETGSSLLSDSEPATAEDRERRASSNLGKHTIGSLSNLMKMGAKCLTMGVYGRNSLKQTPEPREDSSQVAIATLTKNTNAFCVILNNFHAAATQLDEFLSTAKGLLGRHAKALDLADDTFQYTFTHVNDALEALLNEFAESIASAVRPGLKEVWDTSDKDCLDTWEQLLDARVLVVLDDVLKECNPETHLYPQLFSALLEKVWKHISKLVESQFLEAPSVTESNSRATLYITNALKTFFHADGDGVDEALLNQTCEAIVAELGYVERHPSVQDLANELKGIETLPPAVLSERPVQPRHLIRILRHRTKDKEAASFLNEYGAHLWIRAQKELKRGMGPRRMKALLDYQLLDLDHQASEGCEQWEIGYTLLHFAAQYSPGAIPALVAAGADIESRTSTGGGRTPLYIAARNGVAKACRHLVSFGANPNPAREDGWTAVHAAAGEGHVDTLRLLFDASENASVNAEYHEKAPVDNGNWRPLLKAAGNGHVDCIALLIERGADPNAQLTGDHSTALHWAAAAGNASAITELLKHGANPLLADQQGSTPLHVAADRGIIPVCEAIGSAVTSIDVFTATDKQNKTPKDCAQFRNNMECVERLVMMKKQLVAANSQSTE